MKDLLTKKHYCYKVHTSLMTSSAYPPSVYKKNLIPPFNDFSKIPPLRTVDKGGSHYAVIHQYLNSFDCLLMVQILSL